MVWPVGLRWFALVLFVCVGLCWFGRFALVELHGRIVHTSRTLFSNAALEAQPKQRKIRDAWSHSINEGFLALFWLSLTAPCVGFVGLRWFALVWPVCVG